MEKKMKRILLCISLLSAVAVMGQSVNLVKHHRIPLGETYTVKLPNQQKIPQYLAFSGRIDAKNFKSGAMQAMEIIINGMPLDETRLVNKGDYFRFRSDHFVDWVAGGRTITLVYYPWENSAKTIDKEFVHDFVFDLTGLLREKDNSITFVNIFTAFRESGLELKDVRLINDGFPKGPALELKKPRSMGLAKLRHRATSLHRGIEKELKCTDDYEDAKARSLYAPAIPSVTKAVFNINKDGTMELLAGSSNNTFKSTWLVNGTAAAQDGLNRWKTKEFEVTRVVKQSPEVITISDTMKNLTQADLPVIFENSIKVDLDKLDELRVSGAKLPSFTLNIDNLTSREFATTPLIFFRYADAGFGIYLEDDCYRNQFSGMAVDDTLHLANDLFYLEPNSSYTVVWKIYPIADGNYYTMLNTLRRDYNMYQLIPGLFGFVYPFKDTESYGRYYRKKLDSPEMIKKFFEDSGITIPAVTPVLDNSMTYGNEKSDIYREGLRIPAKFLKDIRDAGLDLPLLMYLDPHLLSTQGAFNINTKERWEDYFKDSVMHNSFGKTIPYRSGRLYHLAPRLNNASGKQITKNLDIVLNQEKFSGMFLDEWNHSRARIAYNLSDGKSALLNQDSEIEKKIAIIPLYSKDFLVETGKRVSEGRVTFANQFDCLKELMELPIIHFAEPVAHTYCYLIRAAQAGRTPLTLTCKRNTTAWSDVKFYLRYGVICCYYASRMYGDHVLKKLYPITVKEIYPGVVFGEDRIFTNQSGEFTLNRDKNLTAYIYSDPKGHFSRKVKGGSTIQLKLNPDSEVAVIIEE